MEFLRELFSEPLNFEAFSKAVQEKGIKLADLSSGKYVDQDKFLKATSDLKTAKETIGTLTGELQNLKDGNASAEDWKKKFEDLTADIEAKEKAAEADRIAKEKADNIANRFETVIGEKKFAHEAIKEAYQKKFGEALESKDFQGKSDADIFHELTKDDATAFEGVTTFKLEGGTNKDIGKELDDAQARAVMGLPPAK